MPSRAARLIAALVAVLLWGAIRTAFWFMARR